MSKNQSIMQMHEFLNKNCVLFRTTNRSDETKQEIVQDIHLGDERKRNQESTTILIRYQLRELL